ncbi:MAG: tetratricopeptide repeat protein [Thermoguttaceae bacterium]
MATLRTIVCLPLILVASLASAADGGSPALARKLLLRGKYAEAADLYRPAAAKDPAAAIGLARCLAAQGKDDEAVKALTAGQVVNLPGQTDNLPHNADVLAELARLAFEHGSLDESRKRAEQAIQIDGNQLLARWTLAELNRVTGKLDEAARGYTWIVHYYNDNEVTSAESLRWIGLAAAQSARWNRQSDQFQFLVNDLYPDALKQEPDYWPAHYDAGMLFLEKHNQADASKELHAALEINPNAAEVHAALALLAVERRDVDKAKASLRRALELNPRLLDALLLKSDLLWMNFQPAETLSFLEKDVLPLNPVSEQTLGRIAACYVLLNRSDTTPAVAPSRTKPRPAVAHPSRLAKLVAEVAKRNPHPGEFYFTLAAQLEARNKQLEAEPYFLEAIRVMPRQIGPEGHLGLLYMLAGREDDARKTLRAAFRADPFNVRVKNSLEVLDVLEGMQTLESPRFQVRYQGIADRLFARYASRHLEKVYPALCRRFGYDPPGKTLIEIFSEARGIDGHQWFSARLTALPYLGTVAASTGRMVGMVSPSEPQLSHAMNWARVLTHETVHIINLQQTHFDCPHWYTEGLAVWSERAPRPRVWCDLLVAREASGKLMDLDALNAGFTRPSSSDDWAMAYCQAELCVEYMLSRKGEQSLRDLLSAYTDGLTTPDAIRRVFGVSQAEFERGYKSFLKQQAAKTKSLHWPSGTDLDKLRKAAEEAPTDAKAATKLAQAAEMDPDDLASRRVLARSAAARKDDAAAERWAREAIEIDVRDADMHRILAEALAKRHDWEDAIVEYEALVELKPDDAAAQLVLGKSLLEAHQPAKARRVLDRLLKQHPGYPGAQTLLEMTLKSP